MSDLVMVRAVTRPESDEDKSNYLYDLTVRAFFFGTDPAIVFEYVNTLLSGRLHALEIRICSIDEFERMYPDIQNIINEHKWRSVE